MTHVIEVGSKWIDDAPGGYGEVTVTRRGTLEVGFRTHTGEYSTGTYLPRSAFLRLFRPASALPTHTEIYYVVQDKDGFISQDSERTDVAAWAYKVVKAAPELAKQLADGHPGSIVRTLTLTVT